MERNVAPRRGYRNGRSNRPPNRRGTFYCVSTGRNLGSFVLLFWGQKFRHFVHYNSPRTPGFEIRTTRWWALCCQTPTRDEWLPRETIPNSLATSSREYHREYCSMNYKIDIYFLQFTLRLWHNGVHVFDLFFELLPCLWSLELKSGGQESILHREMHVG